MTSLLDLHLHLLTSYESGGDETEENDDVIEDISVVWPNRCSDASMRETQAGLKLGKHIYHFIGPLRLMTKAATLFCGQ